MKLGKIGEILKIAKKTYEKHDRLILTVITIGGTLYAVYRAAKDGPKYREILDQCEQEGADTLEKIKRLGGAAAPVIAATGVSVLAAGAHFKVAGDVIKGLADAYTVAKTGKEVFEDCTEKIVGPEKTEEIRKEVQRRKVERCEESYQQVSGEVRKIVETGHGNTLIYDEWSKTWFRSDINFLRNVGTQMKARILGGDETVMVAEFYQEIGLKASKSDKFMGWHPSRYRGWNADEYFVDFAESGIDEANQLYAVMSFHVEPDRVNKPNSAWGR